MNGNQEKKQRRDYPWRRWTRRLLLGVVCLAVLVGLAVAGVQWRADALLQRQLAAIRAKGEPVTPEELAARHPAPPKEQDAAETYGRAGALLKEAQNDDEYLARLKSVDDTGVRSRFEEGLFLWMEAYLAEHADSLGILLDAANQPAVRYNWSKSWDSPESNPDLGEIHEAARLLRLEAFVAAEHGDAGRAMNAIVAALAMDRTLRDAPLTIMQMIRLALRSMTCQSIPRTLPLAGYSDEQLLRLSRALTETDDPEALANAFIAERAMGLQGFERISGAARLFLAASGARERYMDYMTQLVEASRLPAPEALERVEQLDRETHATSETLLPRLSNIFIPRLGGYILQLAESDAIIRCTQAAIAVERYKLAHGILPEIARDLVPEFLPGLPEDPFDGTPLHYFTDENGYSVYSIGADREDNGGMPIVTNREGDIVFRVERGE
ncbi:MAG: PepSY domain-containing protein [Candidatus Hydrogenedens sp.]|nr:hypothetical protein [Candidatus Hydrogenedentota bacterium]NLF57212.1 PepSY domain-containing protein [Candidatus Hydrogenedens sp.]